MDKVIEIALHHPALSDLDKGAGETSFQWYARCHRAVWDVRDLAFKHKAGAGNARGAWS